MPANVIRPIPTRPSSLPVPERPQSQTTMETDQSESQGYTNKILITIGSCIPDESMPTLLSTPLTIDTTPKETGYATTEQSEYEHNENANNFDSEQLQEIMDTLRMNKIELNRNSRMFDELKARIRIMEEEAESDPYQHSYEFAMTIVRVKRKINDLEVLTDRLQY